MASWLIDLAFAFWFFVPAGVANMVPILVARLPLVRHWDTPMDFGKSFQGKRIFGTNKTWRGLIFGVLAGILICLAQFYVGDQLHLSFLDTRPEYDQAQPIILGLLLGLGALLGDAIESFFKRRSGVKAGETWFPFDQLDYIFGAVIFTWWLVPVGFMELVSLFIVWFIMHLLFSYIGFRTGFKKQPI